MDVKSVLEVLEAFDDVRIRVWLDGGWGVDALLGERTRDHADLDIILNRIDVPKMREALLTIGYEIKAGATEGNLVFSGEHGRQVDAHPIEFDERGYGFFELGEGRRWPFPRVAFTGEGLIGERRVSCLTADAQVQCHGQGYEPTENDFRDMERLQERFGVVLPIHLCRR